MSNANTSLPVRTENDGDVVVRLGDSLVPSQQLTVNPDGSVNITDNGGSITVDGEVELGAATLAALENITVSATDLDIRDLAFATDKVDVSGSDITSTVTATDFDIRDLVFATDKVDVSGSIIALDSTTLAALENITVSATDLDIRDLTSASDSVAIANAAGIPLEINADGSINVVPQEDPGTEVVNFDESADLAGGATSNHDLVFATPSRLYQVLGTASGRSEIRIQIESGAGTGIFNTVAVRLNSTATPDMDMTLSKYAAIPAGARVRVIRTNRDNQPLSISTTIVGILG